MTWCGSRRRAISGFSGNCGLCFRCGTGRRSAHCVVVRFGMVDYHGGGRLFGEELEGFSEVHSKCFLGGKKLEHSSVVVEIRTRTIAPGVALTRLETQLLLDLPMRPLRDCFGRFYREAVRVERFGVLVLPLQLLESGGGFLAHGHDLKRQYVDVARVDASDVIGEAE